jgi:glycerophosphoryl diester phosphodiesterase
MAQHRLVSDRLLEEVRDRSSTLYAWTVNDREMIGRLRTLGVDGIVTADPRLFG